MAASVSSNQELPNSVTKEDTEMAKAKSNQELPDSVTLASPYGYDPENGEPVKMWAAGQIVTDADEIADLIERQAPLEE